MLVHGLAAALVLAAAPLLAQTVEVTTLPGDAPGDKVAFQFSESEVVTAGANASVEIPIPDGAAMTIETVTARGFAPLNILPEVNLFTFLGESEAKHVVALERKGTDLAVGSLNVYEGTHSVRLRHCAERVRPRVELRNMVLTSTTGNVTFRVSVAGYVTAATRCGGR
jgi:hypothetical protein